MNSLRKTILITGASGFVGSHLVEKALDAGYEVWAAVRRTSSRSWLRDPRIHFIELDLLDRTRLDAQLLSFRASRGVPRFDYVAHAAAATKCLRSADFRLNNVEATRNLVDALDANGMLPERLVFVSSLSLFGAIKEQPCDGSGKHIYPEIKDYDTPRPNTAYGESKWEAEKYLRSVSGLRHVIIRPTGVYGPRERDYFLMAKSIKGHVDFAVGFKPQEITFVYVDDLVQAILKALTAEGVEGRAFFISDGETYDSRTFSDLIRAELGRPWWVRITAPLWLLRLICMVNGAVCHARGRVTTLNMDKYHILAQRNWRCDIEPARRLLGYEPRWSLERGVKETVRWYKENGWL